MMAPAAHASDMPSAWPIPNRATPMVAIVVHELPDSTDINAQMTHADTRKNWGIISCTP